MHPDFGRSINLSTGQSLGVGDKVSGFSSAEYINPQTVQICLSPSYIRSDGNRTATRGLRGLGALLLRPSGFSRLHLDPSTGMLPSIL